MRHQLPNQPLVTLGSRSDLFSHSWLGLDTPEMAAYVMRTGGEGRWKLRSDFEHISNQHTVAVFATTRPQSIIIGTFRNYGLLCQFKRRNQVPEDDPLSPASPFPFPPHPPYIKGPGASASYAEMNTG